MASQAHGVRGRTSLSESQTDRAVWTVIDDVSVGGARAVALFLAVAWNTRLPLMPWRVPALPWMLDRAYEFVARNRHRIPGDTPWCVTHPEQCSRNGG